MSSEMLSEMPKALSRYLIWRVVESAQVGGLANLRNVSALSSGSGRGEAGNFGQNKGVRMVVRKEISSVISFHT